MDYISYAVCYVSYLFYNWKLEPLQTLHYFTYAPYLSLLW